ncbi:MAG TPA: hypothetical protein VGD43_13195 [Micromonospora sp.]
MALTNGSFEDAGANSYTPDGWTISVTTGSGEGAFDFATVAVPDADQGTDTTERFDTGWADDLIFEFEGFFVDLEYAFFDASSGTPREYEDFEDLWGAGPASVVSTNGPFVLSNGMTLTVSLDGAPAQSIGFLTEDFVDITDARPEEVARVISEQAVGFSAQLYGAAVRLISDATGPAVTLEVTGGTANAELGFSTVQVAGTTDGSPFIHSLEFSFGSFAGNQFEGYEAGWGTSDLEADPDDLLTRYTMTTDSMETWFTMDADPDPDDTSGRIPPIGIEFFDGTFAFMTTI